MNCLPLLRTDRVYAANKLLSLLFLTPFLFLAHVPAKTLSLTESAYVTAGPSGPTNQNPVNQSDEQTVLIGIRVVPPFVTQEPDGSYGGLTIALWEHIASEMNLKYHYVELDIAGLLHGVALSGPDPHTPNPNSADPHASEPQLREVPPLFAAASALTITAEREEILDFTHPFFVTGLGIAVPYQPSNLWQAILTIFSVDFLWIVLLLILLLLFWGVVVWLFERQHNSDEFGGSPIQGIGSGFWWAAVTMTTVGYGDKSPKSFAGRLTGFIWMFAGIILISFFTASIASSLTVTQLDSRVSGPQDLPFVRTGALHHSATTVWLDENRIRYRPFDSIADGLQAVANDEIDAFVHDAPIIRYYSSRDFRNEARVLSVTFNDQYYGIALPLNSPHRNEINRIMLEYISGDEWQMLQHRYLGN